MGIFYLFGSLVRQSVSSGSEPKTAFELVIHQFLPIMAIVLSLISALIGYLLLRGAGRFAKQAIPDKDRDLLTGLIQEEKEKGINLYVTLSSLTGATGVFQKLGLVGLPLTTVGLTVFFTLLGIALLGNDKTKDHAEKMLDLSKLTLGAFIGSYVQRQATEGPKSSPTPTPTPTPTPAGTTPAPTASKKAAPMTPAPTVPAPDKPPTSKPDKPEEDGADNDSGSRSHD